MPYAKPRQEPETWCSRWFAATNGLALRQMLSSSGASVTIDASIGVDGLRELQAELRRDNDEFEQRIRMLDAMDEVLGLFDGSELEAREREIGAVFGWVVLRASGSQT